MNEDFPAALARLGARAPAVVFPDGGEDSYRHDRAGARWDAYVVREVIPAAVRRLHADPRRVAIGGISMGGFGAYDVARRHPGRFCPVGGHSAAMWLRAADTAPGAFDDAAGLERNDVVAAIRRRGRAAFGTGALWLGNGDADPFHAADAALARALGIRRHVWPGGHTSGYWRAHYAAYLRFHANALARCRPR